jgi:hypothetical protein
VRPCRSAGPIPRPGAHRRKPRGGRSIMAAASSRRPGQDDGRDRTG